MIQLTQVRSNEEDRSIYINPAHVIKLTPAKLGTRVLTRVWLHGQDFEVTWLAEPLDEVAQLLRGEP